MLVQRKASSDPETKRKNGCWIALLVEWLLQRIAIKPATTPPD